LARFVALCVSGSRTHQAAGPAGIAGILSAFSMLAARNGILLPQAGCVRDAVISGIGRCVYPAKVGRDTRIGMREVKIRRWQGST
jgi:hypothetical protein